MKPAYFGILLSVVCLPVSNTFSDGPFVVAGYLPDYRLEQWSQETEPLTDIIFFGMSAPKDGRFNGSVIAQDQLVLLKRIKEKSNCRMLFTIGGWDKSEGFVQLAADTTLRSQFVQDVAAFCVKNGFDGVDFDWEHPEGAEQIQSLAELLAETHTVFSQHKLIVTIAQAGWQDLGSEVYKAVDRVHLMSYDHDFPQATLEKSKADVQRLINAGCPRSKIVLGLPFYGRNKARAAKTFSELQKDATFSTNINVVDGYAFNNSATIEKKVRYARAEQLGGVMIWESGQDAAAPNSLLESIGKSMKAE